MRHLFKSKVQILEPVTTIELGARVQSWSKVSAKFDSGMQNGEMMCRIDLIFTRIGKDVPMPVVSGRTPDRTGTLFCMYTPALKAGQILQVMSGPHKGQSFQLKTLPDEAQDYNGTHHIEIQLFEVSQVGMNFPAGQPT